MNGEDIPAAGDILEHDGREILVQFIEPLQDDGYRVLGRYIADDGTIDALADVTVTKAQRLQAIARDAIVSPSYEPYGLTFGLSPEDAATVEQLISRARVSVTWETPRKAARDE